MTDDVEPRFLLVTALAHLLREEPDPAAALLARLQERAPDHPGLAPALRATTAARQGEALDLDAIASAAGTADLDVIREHFAARAAAEKGGSAWFTALLNWPPDGTVWRYLWSGAVAALDDGRPAAAFCRLRQIARRWPERTQWRLLVEFLQRAGRLRLADRLAEAVLPPAAALQVRAETAMFRGEAEAAEALFSAAGPGLGDARRLAVYHLQAHLLMGRLADAERAAEEVGGPPLVLGWRAMCSLAAGAPAEALVVARRCVAEATNDVHGVAYGFLGLAEHGCGRTAEAGESFRHAVGLQAGSPWLRYLRAAHEAEHGDAAEGRRLLARARAAHRGAFEHFMRLRAAVLRGAGMTTHARGPDGRNM